jgi:ADP-heptose:LPS heptosyltransferase/predicted SAM-dependent methyltransferase
MTWSADLPEGNEAAKIKYEIVPYTRGRGLDLGCNMFKAFPHFIGIDDIDINSESLSVGNKYAVRLSQDVRTDATDLSLFSSKSMDFVFSSHLLEHIKEPEKALAEWWRVIRTGGYLVLYLPHADLYPRRGEPGANPLHHHDFVPQDIVKMMTAVGYWDLVVSEKRDRNDEYSFFQVYRKLEHKIHLFSYSRQRPRKKICIVRYGGFGDMIMLSNILPGLKRQGWHITVMTTPRGHEVIKTDPHVDDFIIQDTNQIENEELVPYWRVWEKKFDRWINLSESVEGTFLILPGRPQSHWPAHIRRDMLNYNYVEFHHKLAGTKFEPVGRFYPTKKEAAKAEKRRKRIAGKVILWPVDGSSVHKFWPYMDNAIARILLNCPEYKIVLVGNHLSSLLESGWENEPRVIKKCGKWSIRETLAFARVCDMVIGPETGVMNSVGFMNIPKILFLSHSSSENISKHWVNVEALEPDGTPCWPCHLMHYGWDFCNRDSREIRIGDKVMLIEGAHCQTHISVDKFWESFKILQRLIV